jgi:hypothetical protein
VAARSLLPLVLLALVSCESTTDTAPAGFSRAIVSSAEPVRAWRVVAEGRELGAVVQFDASPGSAGRYYSVRNPWQQELGTIDAQGRAWRFVPHEREARWVATGTLAEGAAAILEAAAVPETAQPAELVEVPLEALDPARGAAREAARGER